MPTVEMGRALPTKDVQNLIFWSNLAVGNQPLRPSDDTQIELSSRSSRASKNAMRIRNLIGAGVFYRGEETTFQKDSYFPIWNREDFFLTTTSSNRKYFRIIPSGSEGYAELLAYAREELPQVFTSDFFPPSLTLSYKGSGNHEINLSDHNFEVYYKRYEDYGHFPGLIEHDDADFIASERISNQTYAIKDVNGDSLEYYYYNGRTTLDSRPIAKIESRYLHCDFGSQEFQSKYPSLSGKDSPHLVVHFEPTGGLTFADISEIISRGDGSAQALPAIMWQGLINHPFFRSAMINLATNDQGDIDLSMIYRPDFNERFYAVYFDLLFEKIYYDVQVEARLFGRVPAYRHDQNLLIDGGWVDYEGEDLGTARGNKNSLFYKPANSLEGERMGSFLSERLRHIVSPFTSQPDQQRNLNRALISFARKVKDQQADEVLESIINTVGEFCSTKELEEIISTHTEQPKTRTSALIQVVKNTVGLASSLKHTDNTILNEILPLANYISGESVYVQSAATTQILQLALLSFELKRDSELFRFVSETFSFSEDSMIYFRQIIQSLSFSGRIEELKALRDLIKGKLSLKRLKRKEKSQWDQFFDYHFGDSF